MKKMFITAVLMSLITGCVSMQVSPADDAADAKAKALTVPKGKALVYIVRPTSIGKPFAHEITLDGKRIGSTCGYYYIYVFVSPGKHKFTASGDYSGDVELTVEAGKIYFIQQRVQAGVWKGGSALAVVSETEGRKYLSECRLSSDYLAGN